MKRFLALLFGFLALANAAFAQPVGGYYASTATLAASKVIATDGGRRLLSFEVAADSTLSGAAWWVMIFDATALPSNGTVTPAKCYAAPSGQTQLGGTFDTDGPRFDTGIVIGVSTTGCFTLTTSVHSFISADFQ